MPRSINGAGYLLVKEFEGLRLRAYLCPAGVWTIGYGHTDGVREGMTITQTQADDFLDRDLDWAEECVGKFAKDPSDNEFAAMVSLCFNIGAARFAKSTVLRLHNAGDKLGAARAFRMWNKATVGGKLVELPGLTRRRLAEEGLYLKPSSESVLASPSMPQEVAPPKRAITGKTVVTGAIGTAAAAGAVADQVMPAITAVQSAVEAATQAATTMGGAKAALVSLLDGRALPVALTAVAVCCIAFVVWRYVIKARRGEVVST